MTTQYQTLNEDPRNILADAPMSRAQVTAVIICFFLTALDGFDVLSISFASPGIAAEWGVDMAVLGIVLSMELIGMTLGSIFLGSVADKIGRRPTILWCLVTMVAGMFLASTSQNVVILSVYRLVTGLGIGGMLASTNAMAAEFSNAKRRNLSVIFMASGYPVGAIIGGSIASGLLVYFSWQSVFLVGATFSLIMIPLTWYLLPESIEYLIEHQPKGALDRVNATLRRMGHAMVEALPNKDEHSGPSNMLALFSPAMIRKTLLLTVAYFAHIMTFYFILKWIPKIVVDIGFAPALAGGVLVWTNVGGLVGSIILGLLTQRYAVRGLTIVTLILAGVMVVWFGQPHTDLAQLSLAAAGAGFFTNAAIVGLFAILAQTFPTALRASGTGFVIGIGRGASTMGPIIAGFLFAAGIDLPQVAILMGSGSLVAAIALILMKQHRLSAELNEA